MASTLAHAASASLLALTFAHVKPNETPYVVAALAAATILDLDHVVYIIKDRAMYRRVGYQGNLHHARSPFHELFGLMVVGLLSGLLFLVDQKLACVVFVAFAVHIVQDWVIGRSHPLAPVDTTEMQFFVLTFKKKVLVDMAIVAISGGLWIVYLFGGR
jgi:hypothetical protein